MQDLADILADVSKRLDAAAIPFMVTGAVAQNYYAVERMTADIDIVVELGIDDVSQVAAEFERDYYVSRESILSAVHNRSQFNLIHLESIIKVDCILKKDTEYAETAFRRRQSAEVAGARTFMATKEDLILSKLLWAKLSDSELQVRDLRHLLSTGYDLSYLGSWAERLGVADLLARCRRG